MIILRSSLKQHHVRPDDVPTSYTTRISIEDKARRLNRSELSELGIPDRQTAFVSWVPRSQRVALSEAPRDTDVMVKGTLLAESLRIGAVLEVDALTVGRIFRSDVAATVTSAQPGVWTFVEFEGPDEIADTLARSLAETLRREGGWYADFTVGNDHVVVFADRVFRYERGDRKERRKIEEYAAAVGVPLQQIDRVD